MQIDLGGRLVGDGHPTYVIAELGINHQGDVCTAEKLIDAAAYAGADAVKLQKRTVDVVFTPEQLARPLETQWGKTYGDSKRALELPRQAYVDLARYAKAKGLVLTASCWDEQALADVCEWVDPPWLKIASASITDHVLLRAHARTWKPLVMSTGMSTMDEIDAAVDAIALAGGDPRDWAAEIVLLACTSSYPCPPEEMNLLTIPALRKLYTTLVGYSHHDRSIASSVAAVALGACVVERHLTLDRTMFGSDHAASIEPSGFARMVRDIRMTEKALGDGVKRVYDSELEKRAKLRRVGT